MASNKELGPIIEKLFSIINENTPGDSLEKYNTNVINILIEFLANALYSIYTMEVSEEYVLCIKDLILESATTILKANIKLYNMKNNN